MGRRFQFSLLVTWARTKALAAEQNVNSVTTSWVMSKLKSKTSKFIGRKWLFSCEMNIFAWLITLGRRRTVSAIQNTNKRQITHLQVTGKIRLQNVKLLLISWFCYLTRWACHLNNYGWHVNLGVQDTKGFLKNLLLHVRIKWNGRFVFHVFCNNLFKCFFSNYCYLITLWK